MMKCYKVEVETTNALGDTFYVKKTNEYFGSDHGIFYAVANSTREIYERFGDEVVLAIKK